MRAIVFAKRNLKELLRDPLSYIFCLGFPIVMLLVMTAINGILPSDAGMTIFSIENLTPGVAVFGLSFVMLFASLSVSKDRSGAFLIRLFSSPLTASDFIAGYALPLLIMAIGQLAIIFICGAIVGLIDGTRLSLVGSLLSSLSLLPIAVFFIGIGIFFGTILGEKAAPPCSSIIISLCGILGGIWFDISVIPEDNSLGIISRALPFSHAVTLAHDLSVGAYDAIWLPLAISSGWAVGMFALSIIVFKLKMRLENK